MTTLPQIPFKLTDKQKSFLKAVKSKAFRYMLFGGGFGGGKSFMLSLCLLGIASQYPGARLAYIRKNMTVLKRTSLVTFEKVMALIGIPGVWNGQDKSFTFDNGSLVMFLEADETKDREFNKLRGLELTACAIDEANELSEKAFNVLIGRIGRENMLGEKTVPATIFMSCNPSDGWLFSRFYDPWTKNTLTTPYYFEQALAKDNEFLSPEYLKGLEDMPEAEYQRYVLGNWSYSDDPNQLIPFAWSRLCVDNKPYVFQADLQEYLGVDVARFGKDKTVFAPLQDTWNYDFQEFTGQDTTTTGERIMLYAQEKSIGYQHIQVDVVGLGAGAVDTCHAKNFPVEGFNGGEAPLNPTMSHFQFRNRRAEAYWLLREAIKTHEISFADHDQLLRELTQLRYFIKDKFLLIEDKTEMKKRLGYSPDHADALCMAWWARAQSVANMPHGFQFSPDAETGYTEADFTTSFYADSP